MNVTHTTTLSGWVARLKIIKYKEYALIFLEEINKGKTAGNLVTKISSYKIQNIKGVYYESGNEKFYVDFQVTSKGLEVRYINANYGGSSGRQGGGYSGSGSSIKDGYTSFSVGDAAFIGACLLD